MTPTTLPLGTTLLALAGAPAAAQSEWTPRQLPIAFDVHLPAAGQIEFVADRPDLDAPVGVVGAHPQYEQGLTFTYRYTATVLEGLVDGREELSNGEVFARGYASVPTKVVREVHHFGLLVGHDERLSFLLGLPLISTEMDVEDPGGAKLDPRSIGLGDLEFSTLYTLRSGEGEQLHLNLGVSLPSGSREEKDRTPTSGGANVKLPYALQLGSGTFDLVPGLSYSRTYEDTSWGAQAIQTVRLGENSDDYTLGDETLLTAWVTRRLREDLSGSVRLAYLHKGRIDGRDDDLDPTDNPASDPHAQGGDRFDLSFGVNYTMQGGQRFAAEIGWPLFQDLNGPQTETDVVYSVGWRISF